MKVYILKIDWPTCTINAIGVCLSWTIGPSCRWNCCVSSRGMLSWRLNNSKWAWCSRQRTWSRVCVACTWVWRPCANFSRPWKRTRVWPTWAAKTTTRSWRCVANCRLFVTCDISSSCNCGTTIRWSRVAAICATSSPLITCSYSVWNVPYSSRVTR